MKIAGIYLAAGNSSRMGSNKLVLPVGTMTVGSLALETTLKSSLDKVYIITKDEDEEDVDWLPAEMKLDARCSFIKCPIANNGQSESLRYGIQQAQTDRMDAVIVILADQPFITVQMLEEMIACTKNNQMCRFVATTYEQTIMPPVLFSSSMYTELLELRGDKGAKAILHGDILQKGKLIPCADKRLVFNVDTEADYEAPQLIEKTK